MSLKTVKTMKSNEDIVPSLRGNPSYASGFNYDPECTCETYETREIRKMSFWPIFETECLH